MFSKNIIGTAMGLVLGIGYTGNGFALAFLGSALLPPLTATSKGESRAWRILLLISGAFGLAAALIALCLADDTPEEKYYRRKEEESESEQPSSMMSEIRSRTSTFRRAAKHYGTWILALQYAMSVGINTALLNIAVSHFVNSFPGTTSSQASAVTNA